MDKIFQLTFRRTCGEELQISAAAEGFEQTITNGECESTQQQMHADLALKMMSDLFWMGFLVCLPVLGFTMLTGLLISIIQVVTQVQEMSLTFVPKLMTAGIALVVFGPWMLRKLSAYFTQLWAGIPAMF